MASGEIGKWGKGEQENRGMENARLKFMDDKLTTKKSCLRIETAFIKVISY